MGWKNGRFIKYNFERRHPYVDSVNFVLYWPVVFRGEDFLK
jgi:hypothetical protein